MAVTMTPNLCGDNVTADNPGSLEAIVEPSDTHDEVGKLVARGTLSGAPS